MWSKIYVGIIVLILLIFLHWINMLINYADKLYGLKENYGMPTGCLSTAICGMSGNILLIFIVYLVIPDSYYEQILKMINPTQIHHSADSDILGINKLTTNISNRFL
jgi:hypothetical protein